MKTFQIVTLFCLIAASMAFAPNKAPQVAQRFAESGFDFKKAAAAAIPAAIATPAFAVDSIVESLPTETLSLEVQFGAYLAVLLGTLLPVLFLVNLYTQSESRRAGREGGHLAGKMATEDLIGQVLPLKFLEVNQENNKLVVSNRKAVVETQMADLSRGDLVEGVVQALKPYGAFIEVGGMSGLLHISQISYDRIEDLEQVMQPGMAVKCMIIDHDKVNGRIALSTKTLEPEPGDMLRDSARVFDMAEESAEKYHTKMEEERKARESAARDIVLGLGDSLDGLGDDLNGDAAASSSADPLADVSDSLDSLLS